MLNFYGIKQKILKSGIILKAFAYPNTLKAKKILGTPSSVSNAPHRFFQTWIKQKVATFILSIQFGPQDPKSVQNIHSDLSRAILVSIITNINQLHLSALVSELLQALLSKINKLSLWLRRAVYTCFVLNLQYLFHFWWIWNFLTRFY